MRFRRGARWCMYESGLNHPPVMQPSQYPCSEIRTWGLHLKLPFMVFIHTSKLHTINLKMSAAPSSLIVSSTGKTRLRAALERARDGGAPAVGQWLEFPGFSLARTVAGLGSDVSITFHPIMKIILIYFIVGASRLRTWKHFR